MNFDDLDARMRVYETSDDHCVLPGMQVVVRLDGRGFTRLTREVWRLEAPFDERFRDLMIETAEHLMDCGFGVVYGYTQSDEISLLLRPDDNTFGRKTRKIISVLAGEASAHFTLAMRQMACFDARVSQLPSDALVVDYFRWRQEDAYRNALNAHAYWALRRKNLSPSDCTQTLAGLSSEGKSELLLQQGGGNFNHLPAWQKRGVGLYWVQQNKVSVDPRTGATVTTQRRRLQRHLDLPQGDAYDEFLQGLQANARGA